MAHTLLPHKIARNLSFEHGLSLMKGIKFELNISRSSSPWDGSPWRRSWIDWSELLPAWLMVLHKLRVLAIYTTQRGKMIISASNTLTVFNKRICRNLTKSFRVTFVVLTWPKWQAVDATWYHVHLRFVWFEGHLLPTSTYHLLKRRPKDVEAKFNMVEVWANTSTSSYHNASF